MSAPKQTTRNAAWICHGHHPGVDLPISVKRGERCDACGASESSAAKRIDPVAPGRCPAIGDVGAVQPQMDRGNVATSTAANVRDEWFIDSYGGGWWVHHREDRQPRRGPFATHPEAARTPPAFRDVLVRMARSVYVTELVA